ncbi:MAG: GDP-mannose:glycolipid 4-beta-D-mannosyltransferase precursor [Candidatus Heimdallarchaeota archaeon LC_3]|nr:MAG: GDP-mannose:glycolipid 4-beta-D-mannosyltransferase precursor [Candidatus Heimdallarchaeota archaeon LC_3]
MKVIASPAFNNKNNPYNPLLYSEIKKFGLLVEDYSIRKVLFNRISIWHLHWPDTNLNRKSLIEAFFKTCILIFLIEYCKILGTKLIWTAHNIQAHEKRHQTLERIFWKYFLKRLDGVINLSAIGKRMLIKKHPIIKQKLNYIIYHGHYQSAYPNIYSRLKSREKLNIDDKKRVILFLGQIARYKNVDKLIEIFKSIKDKELVLIIAGNPIYPEYEEEIKKSVESEKRIKLFLKFIRKNEIQLFFNSANLAIFPFTKIFNSGSAILSLSFNCPILVPNIGSMKELQNLFGESWVKVYKDNLNDKIILDSIEWSMRNNKNELPIYKLNWDKIAKKTINAYINILNQ